MEIESIYIEPNDNKDQRFFKFSVLNDDKFSIQYENNCRETDATNFITIEELFDILSFNGDRLKHREDEAYQAKLDGLTAELKQTKSELNAKKNEVFELTNQIKYLKIAFKDGNKDG